MADPRIEALKRKRRALEQQARFIGEQRMISGRLLADGSVTLAGAPAGKTWVRGADDSREETAVWGYVGIANAPVKMSPNSSGEYEIVGVDYPEGVERLGSAVHAVTAAPALDDELAPRSIPGNGFKPGRLEASQLGGLNVHVSGFWHAGGFWQGGTLTDGVFDATTDDLDVSSFEPGTVNYVCWVVVYLDPATNTLDAVAGTPVFGLQQDLLETDIDALTLPDGVYPLGAFAFENGQTAIDGSTRMVDRRLHLDKTRGSIADALDVSYDPTASGLTATDVQAAIDELESIIPTGGSGIVELLNYTETADLYSASAMTANTWYDLCADQTFTVTDNTADLELHLSVAAPITGGAHQYGIRVVIDSAGTPITQWIGGGYSPSAGGPQMGITLVLPPLSAASHTIKAQVAVNTGGNALNLRPTLAPNYEGLIIQLYQR